MVWYGMVGYVPSEHFDDKPLSGIEFFSYVESLTLPKEVCKDYTMDVWWNIIARSIRIQQFTFMSTLKNTNTPTGVSGPINTFMGKFLYGCMDVFMYSQCTYSPSNRYLKFYY